MDSDKESILWRVVETIRRFPNKIFATAIYDGKAQTLTYRQLWLEARAFAGMLRVHGVKREQICLIMLRSAGLLIRCIAGSVEVVPALLWSEQVADCRSALNLGSGSNQMMFAGRSSLMCRRDQDHAPDIPFLLPDPSRAGR